MYDYLIVGAGLSGAIFAHEATKRGKKVKVIDKRDHIGGNIYCEDVEGINVHKYGAHIFHTSNKKVWDYVNQFAEFNNYINSPVANYKGSLYNLPFNMNTFYAMWGTKTPQEVKEKIAEQTADMKDVEPKNLEEQAIKLIGPDIYEKLIKGYTEKQWGRSATDLPPFIIKRLPVRLTFDNNYFNDRYQGIPIGGYNVIIENMLGDVEVELGVDFFANREELEASADKVVFTGMIDQYFDYKHGELEYRSLRFEHEVLDEENHQGNAVVNYTEREIPYTRIIEHKHFEYGTQPKTVITREYPADWKRGDEPYYPINDEKNNAMFAKYQEEAEKNVEHPKLRWITHKEFMPEEYLPTYNSAAIELNLHRIEGLSENYLYFNDDVYLIRDSQPSDFYKNGQPKLFAVYDALVPWSAYTNTYYKNVELIYCHFPNKKALKSSPWKFFNYRYGHLVLKNLLLLPWGPTGYVNNHLATPMKKSTLANLWQIEGETLDRTSRNKIRNYEVDVNQYICQYWHIESNQFYPISKNFGETINLHQIDRLESIFKDKHKKLLCVNDEVDFKEENIIRFKEILQERYPEKSAFEK